MGRRQCTGWLGELHDLAGSSADDQDADWRRGSTVYRQAAGGGSK
jgi:hypothetical protein